MWPDPVSNPGPLTNESGALLTAVHGPACYMLDNPFVIFGVGSILLLLFYFYWKILFVSNVDPDQMSRKELHHPMMQTEIHAC